MATIVLNPDTAVKAIASVERGGILE